MLAKVELGEVKSFHTGSLQLGTDAEEEGQEQYSLLGQGRVDNAVKPHSRSYVAQVRCVK